MTKLADEPIIESLLDTDLYTFTQQQVVWHSQPKLAVRYDFRCRSESIDLSPYADEIREQVDAYCSLRFSEAEVEYLGGIRFLHTDYVRSLVDLRIDSRAVHISTNPFSMTVEGNWYETIMFEVPLLAIVGEVYYRHTHPEDAANVEEGRKRLREKIEYAKTHAVPFSLIEFGTRRRYSRLWQREVVQTLKQEVPAMLIGSSNVRLAETEALKPFGTMAHQFLQAHQALAPLHKFQKAALEAWMQEYRGDLGIALSDVVGMDAFLRDFDRLFALAYAGCRHDSGDPTEWGEKLIQHYENLAIDPKTKVAVFSDSLDFPKAFELAEHFRGRIRTQFGIGTNLTNDMGFKPLNIVIKMTECDGQPVAKLSDSSGKQVTQNELYLKYLAQVFRHGGKA